MALPQNRQERNVISTTVSENLPDFVRQDHPTFVKFVETYYEWLESKENSYFAPLSLNGVVDVDKTSADFIKYFKTHTMNKFPDNFKSVKGDTLEIKKILKRIRSFYLAKGTESSIEFLIRLLFDVYVETYRPAEDMFKTSGGFWYAPTVVRCTDSNPVENAKIRGQRIEFVEDEKVVGTAVVDEIHQFVMSGYTVLELELVEISNFILTDKSTIKITRPDGVILRESLFSMITGVPLSSPTGKMYTVDDPVIITGSDGSNFKGSVEALNKVGSIRKIRIDEPGLNYFSSGDHVVSVSTTTGTGATFESASYGYIFKKPGVYLNNDGKLSSTEFLQDNFRYQIHSYVIRTEASLKEYEYILKDLVHPAGKKVLGDYFVYRTGFGPSADFVGFTNKQLYSPFFANYFAYSLAEISDGALTGSNNGSLGLADSAINLRGVCAASIVSSPDAGKEYDYYDFFPFGYDGATGYTMSYLASSNQRAQKTSLGDGLSSGSFKQDLNKFGGISATKEFFSTVGSSFYLEEINLKDRVEDPSRSEHIVSAFQAGDIVSQRKNTGLTHATGIVYDGGWNTSTGTLKVLNISGSQTGFRTPPSGQDGWTATSSNDWKIFNETRGGGVAYTGGSDYQQEIGFYNLGGPTLPPARDVYVNFFKTGDHVYQNGTADGAGITAYGEVLSWRVGIPDPQVNGATLTVKIFGTSPGGNGTFQTWNVSGVGSFSPSSEAAIHRVKGPGHVDGSSLPSAGSTSGGETFFGGGHASAGDGADNNGVCLDALPVGDDTEEPESGAAINLRTERSFGGVIEEITVLNDSSQTGSTLPGWPSGGIDFWIVHPHPNTWHGNVPKGTTWGGITLQSLLKSEYKLTSPPVYGISGEVTGSLNQTSNNDIPGGYGS
tara:strand:+ start:9355 stop:12024 length:2670 start_codon:yes stop_codon:yes gene_type:complete